MTMSLGLATDSSLGNESLWQYGHPSMSPHSLFETHLDLIERSIRRVCLDGRITGADADDFASSVRLALLANDGAILRKYEGRSSFATYITIVIRRLLVDQMRAEGRWYASAEAKRRGAVAMLLDRLLHREHRSVDDAIATLRASHPEVSASELREIAAALPPRAARPRLVELDEHAEERLASHASADERVLERDVDQRSERTSRVVTDALAAMSAEDRVVLRLRFGKGASVADIARALGIDQRPLYRRVESLLAQLRSALQRAGLDAASVTDLIGGAGTKLEFGLRKQSGIHPAPVVRDNGGAEGTT
jgi:RNA polymerase sigma factor (sigma-70 family)